MRRSLQIIIITLTVIVPAAFADSAPCSPGDVNRSLECVARDTGRDETAEASGRAVRKVGECRRIEKLLADPRTHELLMQEPKGRQLVWWYAGNCPLGRSKG